MSPRRRAGGRRDQNRGFAIGLVTAVMLLVGLAMIAQPSIGIAIPSAPANPQIPLKTSEDIELKKKYEVFVPRNIESTRMSKF